MIRDALIAFAAMAALDFVFARYTVALTQRRGLHGALWAAVIPVLNGAVVLSYVREPWILIPVAAGAFAGTYGSHLLSANDIREKAAINTTVSNDLWSLYV